MTLSKSLARNLRSRPPSSAAISPTRLRSLGSEVPAAPTSSPYTLHPTPFTLHLTPCTLHPTPYTLHPTPYTLHPAPYTLHPTPLHPTPYTLHPTPLHRMVRSSSVSVYLVSPIWCDRAPFRSKVAGFVPRIQNVNLRIVNRLRGEPLRRRGQSLSPFLATFEIISSVGTPTTKP